MIQLTRSQRRSLAGEIWCIHHHTTRGTYRVMGQWNAIRFMQRAGLVSRVWGETDVLTLRGIELMTGKKMNIRTYRH